MKKEYIKPQVLLTSLRPEERFAGGSLEGSEELANDVFSKILSVIGLGNTIKGY